MVGSAPFLGPAGQGEIFFKVCRLDLLSPAAADIISYSTFFVSGNIFILNGTELRRLLAANLGQHTQAGTLHLYLHRFINFICHWRFIIGMHLFYLYRYLSIAHHRVVNYTERYLSLSASNRASEAASSRQPPADRAFNLVLHQLENYAGRGPAYLQNIFTSITNHLQCSVSAFH